MFSSIVSPITSLTKKNVPFAWTAAYQTALDMIKHAITNSPVLIYPDPNKQYHLFTDASNHTWSGVLTQTRETLKEKGKLDITYHPITYQLGTFISSQINWSSFVKEVYCHNDVVLQNGILLSQCRSSHLITSCPLQKLIKDKTKNVLIQNCTLEIFSISPHITFQYIKVKITY